jgi:hypothetical protein
MESSLFFLIHFTYIHILIHYIEVTTYSGPQYLQEAIKIIIFLKYYTTNGWKFAQMNKYTNYIHAPKVHGDFNLLQINAIFLDLGRKP